ncbi:phage tail assembly protein [Wolbachia endosymbiont (group A) of Sympetrum striolatum]|uniref:Phage tail assembly protein n=1 Tax=Wolbachia endosymbiont of Sergentomyia squamirostris TaxID=3113640 RepID=A0AAT9GDC1_9RICK|nr:phage tail assembly protein [Wolbachia endosymbiont (group A) of Sympetrum striolatum]
MQKIKLTEPIKIDGILVSEITLRRPKVRDRLAVERMGNSDAEKEVALIANLASISREAVEELDLADYSKIQEVLQGFLSQQKS